MKTLLTSLVIGLETLAASFALDPCIFVCNGGSNTVSVIDPATLAITRTIPVGAGPIRLALLPNASKLYVANTHSTLSVVDTTTMAVVRSITVEHHPQEMETSLDGSRLFVVSRGINSEDGAFTIIDTDTDTVIKELIVGKKPTNLDLSPDGSKIFIATPGERTTTAVGVASESEIARILCGITPRRVYFNLNGTKLYVTNASSSTLSVINPETMAVTATIPTGAHPRGMAFTPDGRSAYCTNVDSATVTVFNVDTDAVIATIPVGNRPWHAEITPAGDYCYVINSASATVSVIKIATQTVEKTLTVGGGAFWGDHYDPLKRLFSTNPDVGTVSVIDTANQTKVTDIATGSQPWMLVVHDPAPAPLVVNPFIPIHLPVGTTSEFDLEGSGFQFGISAALSPDAGLTSPVKFQGASRVTLTVTVAAGAAPGLHDLTLTNPNGQSVTIPGAIEVAAENMPFTVSAVSPNVATRSAVAGTTTTTLLTITGANFVGPLTMTATPAATDLTFQNINVFSGTQFTAEARVTSDAALGQRGFTVTDGDGESVQVNDLLTIQASAALQLLSTSPNTLARGTTVTARLTGTAFAQGMTVAVKPTARGVRVDSVTVISDTAADVVFTTQSTAALGSRDLELAVSGNTYLATRAITVTN